MAGAKDLVFTVFGIDKASNTFDKVGQSMDRMASRVKGANKVAVASIMGVPAASAGAAAAVAGSLGLAAGGFIALSAVALRENEAVRQSWRNLGDTVTTGAAEMAAPMEGHLVKAAGTLQRTFDDLGPTMKRGFTAAGPSLDHLVAGVDQFARRAMPGMVTAVERSEPVFVGMREFMSETGDGVNDFFLGVSDGAESSGRILADFGDITSDTLGTAGALFGMLANDGAPAVSQVAETFGVLLETIEGLASGALPVLFSSATGALGVLGDILSVVEPLAPALGSVIGVMLSAKAGAAVFGLAGDAVSLTGARMEAAGAKGGKASGSFTKLGGVLGAFGPWGAVAGGALMGVSAAADMAYGSAENLTGALMKGGNAAAEARRQLWANDHQLTRFAESQWIGINVQDLWITTTNEANKAVSEQRASMSELERAQVDATAAVNDHLRAVAMYGEGSEQAAASSAILEIRQKALRGAQDQAARATKTLTQRLMEQQDAALALVDANLGLQRAALAYEDAQKAATSALATHGKDSREAREATLSLDEATSRYVATARQEALSHFANKDSVEAQTAALDASNAKILELAANTSGPLGAALIGLIANMDNSALAALGAHREIDGTNEAVITLKDGKTIHIDVNDQATWQINGIQQRVDGMHGKSIDIHIRQLLSTSGPVMADLGNPGAVLTPNAGGLIPGGGPDRDSVPAILTPGEFVVNRRATKAHLPLLQQLNAAAGGDATFDTLNGPVTRGTDRHSVTTPGGVQRVQVELVIRSSGSGIDDALVGLLQRAVRVRGGDVQVVLGGQ